MLGTARTLDLEVLERAIDYQEAKSSRPLWDQVAFWSIAIAMLSFLFSLAQRKLTINHFRAGEKRDLHKYLIGQWSDLLKIYYEKPSYRDLEFTERAFESADPAIRRAYDSFCQRAWGFVYEVSQYRDFTVDPQFRAAVHHIVTYHHDWLTRNPFSYPHPAFWTLVADVQKEPSLVFRHRTLPVTANGEDLDWDKIAGDYHSYLISPFAPEMTAGFEQAKSRNLLVNFLHRNAESLRGKQVADFGCGPGNLIPFLPKSVAELTGVDSSPGALALAERVAREKGVTFTPIGTTIQGVPGREGFDLIISVNSILPSHRQDVVPILTAIARQLRPGGRLIAILPSFDTTTYLRNLWQKAYKAHYQDSAFVTRCMAAFDLRKKVSHEHQMYSDDGRVAQCYHTPETISDEFMRAGLRLVSEGSGPGVPDVSGVPQKVLYPWSLARRFDYGDFSGEDEIWDWFVIAERTPLLT